MKRLLICLAWIAASSLLVAQETGLNPADILKPLADSWPTYSGDYSGRRYSSLTQLNQTTVKNLTLAWTTRLTAGPGGPVAPVPFGPRQPEVIVGGVGENEFVGATTVKGSILSVNGVLYVTAPDNVWALDANDGHLLWRYFWRTRGGTHIGNRGAAMWRNYLFFVTPDDFLISLDVRTGKERWHKEIANFNQQYFLTSAPVVIENHVIVGTGNDLDSPGYLSSFDPETGDLQWKFYSVPMNPGDPGLETWKDLDAARNGGGHPWLPGAYDPETRLYIFGTGNPTPAYMSAPRGAGLDNLFTCAIVAVHVDTGKMAWYFQTSPHEMHDWDSAQTPVLVDGTINGKPRKLLVTASRNGYYFTLDRRTGERLVTTQFSGTVNWAKGLNDKGQPVRDPAKDHHVGGALVSSANGGATNWPPAAFSPDTGLLYVPTAENYAMYYLTELDPRGAMGLGGKEEVGVGGGGSYISAIDYKSGKTVWKHKFRTAVGDGRGGPGLLATAGRLLFGGDVSGNFVAFDPATGKPLWHSRLAANVSNAPQTYLVGGKQHVLVAAGDTLYAFSLY
ncbi:MAG TPA: acido-empty-quinoprotein group A [Vicinamibacterales bacterium]